MKSRIDFAIVTPLEQERRAMLDYLPGAQIVPANKGDLRAYYSVTVPINGDEKYEVIVSDLLSMGRVDAAIVVKDILRRWSPRYVVVAGIAGGYSRAGVKLGDVLIADQIVDFEHQKLFKEGPKTRFEVYRADPRLLVAAKEVNPDHWRPTIGRPDSGQSERHIGPVCTGDKVIADGSLERLAEIWPKLIGVEMEAGGAARATFEVSNAPGFLMVRGVSDLADAQKDTPSTTLWRAYACKVAAAFVAALLRSAPVPFTHSSTKPARREVAPALRCPKCGKPDMKVHSKSGNTLILSCKNCSTQGMAETHGSKITSFVVPGVIALTGLAAVEHFLSEHGTSGVGESIFDILDHFADLI